jgi:hypothetical protein
MWEAGALHDPVRAFRESRDAFARGDWPMLTMSQSNELSSDGHVVLPFAWDPPTEAQINEQPLSGQKWTIYVANPNSPGAANDEPHSKIEIDPFNPTFTFDFDDTIMWSGTDSSGGRLMSIPFSLLNQEPMTPVNAVDNLLWGGVLMVIGGDTATAQITDEAGRTFYTSPPALAALERPRAVNPDPKTRIPNMMLVPLSHSPADVLPIKVPAGFDTAADAPFEMYYAQRNPSGFTWVTPGEPTVTAPVQSALTFLLTGLKAGSYQWSSFTPRLSVSISAPALVASEDLVTIDQSKSGSQSITFQPDKTAPARKFSINIAGWRGDHSPQARSFQIDNLATQPGHALTVSVSDGGKELWLKTSHQATTFDLTVYAGLTEQTVKPRSNVTLEANVIARIRPLDWDPAKISQTAIALEVRSAGGSLLRQVNI